MKFALSLLCLSLVCVQAFACLYKPNFRELAVDRDYIVQGYATGVHNAVPDTGMFRGLKMAKMVITEKLKGSIKEDTIDVIYDMFETPEPNVPVLAFMQLHNGVYYITDTKQGKPHELEVYKLRIKEMATIAALTNTAMKEQQTIDWIIKCAENSLTRNVLLSLEADSNHLVALLVIRRAWIGCEVITYRPLADYQLSRLRAILLGKEDFEAEDSHLASLVYKPGDIEVRDFLAKKMLTKIDSDPTRAILLMYLLLHGEDEGKLYRIYKKAEQCEDDNKKNELKKWANEFLSEVKKN